MNRKECSRVSDSHKSLRKTHISSISILSRSMFSSKLARRRSLELGVAAKIVLTLEVIVQRSSDGVRRYTRFENIKGRAWS
jgi:hypothetical protein